jgi:cell wall-associated NlpC family hydrolase
MLDPDLDELTRERALGTSVDWGNAWAGCDSDGTVQAWPAAAAAELGVDLLQPGPELEISSVLEPMRSEPRHTSEMISEVRAAERLRGLRQEGSWWLVAGADDYVGRVHDWVLREAVSTPGPPDFRYRKPVGTLWVSDHHAAGPLFVGAPLWKVQGGLTRRGGFHLLRTATGDEGWIADGDLESPDALADTRSLLNLVRGLIGIPYRWGGRSPLGFDCSGLVQFAAQRCGADLPRDSTQQSRFGEAVDSDPAVWEVGDLVFFGDPADHVGFSDGRGGLLHCRGQVRIDQLDELPRLKNRIFEVRRWWALRGQGHRGFWTARVGSDQI